MAVGWAVNRAHRRGTSKLMKIKVERKVIEKVGGHVSRGR